MKEREASIAKEKKEMQEDQNKKCVLIEANCSASIDKKLIQNFDHKHYNLGLQKTENYFKVN